MHVSHTDKHKHIYKYINNFTFIRFLTLTQNTSNDTVNRFEWMRLPNVQLRYGHSHGVFYVCVCVFHYSCCLFLCVDQKI